MCLFFLSYAAESPSPGRCCLYSAYDESVDLSGGGNDLASFFKMRNAETPETSETDLILQSMYGTQQTCSLSEFSSRLQIVNEACCLDETNCPQGFPNICSFYCATKYVPLYDACRDEILQMASSDGIPMWDDLARGCLSSNRARISEIYLDVRRHGRQCIFEHEFIDDRDVRAEGHRRALQSEVVADSICNLAQLTRKVKRAVESCRLEESRTPASEYCSDACALDMRSLYGDCHEMMMIFMFQKMPFYDELFAACQKKLDSRAALLLLEAMDCTSRPVILAGHGNCPSPIWEQVFHHSATQLVHKCAQLCQDKTSLGCTRWAIGDDGAGPKCLLYSHDCDGNGDMQWQTYRFAAIIETDNECTDTVAWRNALEDSVHSFGCDQYARASPLGDPWCNGHGLTSGQEFTGGEEHNFPELNCCVCGKAAPVVDDDSTIYVLVDELSTSWAAARMFCRKYYYDLASVQSAGQEHKLVALCAKASHPGGCRTGLHSPVADELLDLSGGETGGKFSRGGLGTAADQLKYVSQS